jgi:hypothetical protein
MPSIIHPHPSFAGAGVCISECALLSPVGCTRVAAGRHDGANCIVIIYASSCHALLLPVVDELARLAVSPAALPPVGTSWSTLPSRFPSGRRLGIRVSGHRFGKYMRMLSCSTSSLPNHRAYPPHPRGHHRRPGQLGRPDRASDQPAHSCCVNAHVQRARARRRSGRAWRR